MPLSFSLNRAVWRTLLAVVALSILLAPLFSAPARGAAAMQVALRPRALGGSVRRLAPGAHAVRAPHAILLRGARGEHLAFPPSAHAPRDAVSVVYLHGRNGLAAKGCPWFREGATELGWLVCPTGVETDERGLSSWGADLFAQRRIVEDAFGASVESGASPGRRIVVGFSQGSYVATDLIKCGMLHADGVVLLGAELHLDPARLREAGVKRVALGAGALDPAFAALGEEAARLARLGVDVRVFDLGAVGHTYATDHPAVLREAIRWAAASSRSPA